MSAGDKIKALQTWCQKVTDGYNGVNVTNFTTSFRDGLAFCAIIHRFRPDLIDYDSLIKGDILNNNQTAFDVAEQKLGVPALLDAKDMFTYSVPDRKCIILYVSQLHRQFQGKIPGRQHGLRTPDDTTSPHIKGITSQHSTVDPYHPPPPLAVPAFFRRSVSEDLSSIYLSSISRSTSAAQVVPADTAVAEQVHDEEEEDSSSTSGSSNSSRDQVMLNATVSDSGSSQSVSPAGSSKSISPSENTPPIHKSSTLFEVRLRETTVALGNVVVRRPVEQLATRPPYEEQSKSSNNTPSRSVVGAAVLRRSMLDVLSYPHSNTTGVGGGRATRDRLARSCYVTNHQSGGGSGSGSALSVGGSAAGPLRTTHTFANRESAIRRENNSLVSQSGKYSLVGKEEASRNLCPQPTTEQTALVHQQLTAHI